MKFDDTINIAVGMSANSKSWKNTQILWSDLVKKLATENKTNETYKQYIAANKQEQSKIKDVGGYVGGYLQGGKRSPKNVVYRQLITLDIDFAHKDFWADFEMIYGFAAVLHSTHKHCEGSPRYRLIIPINREVTADEYVAIARQIAGTLGIELFDNTTFETNRLMFWPSNSIDTEYYFMFQDGEFLDADYILSTYADWRDSSLWPTADRRLKEVHSAVEKQQNPQEKRGNVGLFCKTYGIVEAIDKFLKTIYVPTTIEDRYSYTKGTTAAGLIIYDNTFAFSHHGTDPCSGKLCNAFDLVRIHLFGHLDDADYNRADFKTKSFEAMDEMCKNDDGVKKTNAYNKIISAKYDFNQDLEDEIDDENDDATDDVNWMTQLEVDSKGNYLSTAKNINIVLANDSRLKTTFRQNNFDNKRYIFNSLPWRKIIKPEPVKNVDYSGVRNYIENIYGISSSLKIEDSMALEFEKNGFHPIKDYLKGLHWDGEQRVDNLLIDFFGCKDNVYSRECIRKMLVASVARIFNPGCKFDLVLVLVGPQGTYKSTFIKKLGGVWFSDTLFSVQGKEALEQIQGAWLIEMAELSAFRKAEIEAVKHFISKQEDMFRPAYARVGEVFPRQCTFWGTTNETDFLNDPTGNRRFLPNNVIKENVTKNVFKDLDQIVDQIWAEAVHLYNKGEKLYLSHEAEYLATCEQIKHSRIDDRKGVIEQFLDLKLPENWETRDIGMRRNFLENDALSEKGVKLRDYVCMAEIWCECLKKDKDTMTRYNTREINEVMKSLADWEYVQSTKNFPNYGKQKYYQRKLI
jgi:predicted P-loop ATPase